jgi:hypothetical protein
MVRSAELHIMVGNFDRDSAIVILRWKRRISECRIEPEHESTENIT